MELLGLFYVFIKYTVLFILAFIGYMLYAFVWEPYSIRKKYSKYQNVAMSKKYQPFLGEHAELKELIKQDKYQGYWQIQASLDNPNCDIRLTFSGKQPYFMLNSPKALEEFKALQPGKIDRWGHHQKSFGRMALGSFDQNKSDASWKERRDAFTRAIGINFASQYIPLMIEKVNKEFKKWKEEETIMFDHSMKTITFEIITDILFGKEIKQKVGTLKYKHFDGKMKDMDLQEFFVTLTTDCFKATKLVPSILFPFLIYHNLFNPNNIIHENIQVLWKTLRKFLDNNEDPKSIYSQVLAKDNSLDKDMLMKDMITLYFAGHDTSSHAISSLMYYLKKYPKYYDICFKEVSNELGVTDRSKVDELIEITKLDNMDQLNYTMKEALRYDNPASLSLGYKTLSKVKICGVPLPKDAKIFLAIHGNHYNPTQWQEPEKFIPERFDPESKYYKLPGSSENKARSPYAFIPFSFGLRNCAGKSLATLEIKTIVSLLLMKIDYEIDPEQASNDYIRFGGGSQYKMKVKITKKY